MKVRETQIAFLVLVLAFQGTLAFDSHPESAEKHYLDALEAYYHFDYKTADSLLRKALEQQPNYKMTNYKLACVLAARLSQDWWSWLREIGPDRDPWDQLARAIQIDPEAAKRAAHDPDFGKIRLTPKFQMLIGADLTDSTLVKLLLVAQGEWFGGLCGAWCGNNLIFFENGEVTKRILDEDGQLHGFFTYEHAHFWIEKGTIFARFESGVAASGGFVKEGPLMGTLQLGNENAYFVYPLGDL